MVSRLVVRVNRDEVRRRIYALPRVLSGRESFNGGGEIARGFALRLATTTMSFLKTAFIVKARGGVDAAGEKWKPLAPSTIMARMRKGKPGLINRRRVLAGKAVRKAESDLRHAKTFRKGLATEVRMQAAKMRLKRAWRDYAAAAENIEILRDTGRMFNSLSPGFRGELMPGQFVSQDGLLMTDGHLDVRPGEAVFGTNIPYAKKHHFGDGRCPQRRLWPEVSKWPGVWWSDLRHAAQTGLERAAKLVFGRAA